MKRKILFIGGSLNQTTMMHKISQFFPHDDCYFTPYYTEGFLGFVTWLKILNFTILGGKRYSATLEYLVENNLEIDLHGRKNQYDLIFTCSDILIQKNIAFKRVVLVQEGMTDPVNFTYYLVKYLKFPRFTAGTTITGLSNMYDRFCVASEGYKRKFAGEGVDPQKVVVTGIPNFDNCKEYLNNDFPHKHYVLVATSDIRETWKCEDRIGFIKKSIRIANGRQLIFKLHPNENVERATREILRLAPTALVYAAGNTNHMIANCDVLITKYSTVVYIGLALGKEVYSKIDLEELKELIPLQNGGSSAENISKVGHELLDVDLDELNSRKPKRRPFALVNANKSKRKA